MKLHKKEIIAKITQAETTLWNEFVEDKKYSLLPSSVFAQGYKTALTDLRVMLLKQLVEAEEHE